MKLSLFFRFAIVLLLIQFSISSSQTPTRVYTDIVQKKNVSTKLEVIGTVEYPEISSVSTEISGIVEKVNFEEGDRVRRNDVLVALNSELLEKEIDVAKAIYQTALEEYNMKKWEYERYDTLYQTGDKPLKELKDKQTQFNISFFNMQKAKSTFDKLDLMKQKKSILSPFDGIVIKKQCHKGEWLIEGAPAAIVASGSKVDIVCNVPQDLVTSLSKGDDVNIKANKETFIGKVFAIIPKGDINTRTFPVKIRLNNNSNLMAGMEVKVNFQTGKMRNSFVVSRDAIVMKNDKPFIYVAENSKAVEIPVEIISYEGTNCEIDAKNLNERMKVVVRGNQLLMNGQLLDIVK